MKVGEYWEGVFLDGRNESEHEYYLFKLVEQGARGKRACYLGVKCSWKTGRPFVVADDGTFSAWFDYDGDQVESDMYGEMFSLVRLQKRRGMRKKHAEPKPRA